VHHFVQHANLGTGEQANSKIRPTSGNPPVIVSQPKNHALDVSQRIATFKNLRPKSEPIETDFEFDETKPLRLGEPSKHIPDV